MADFEQLEIAFRYHVTQTLIAADGQLFAEEVQQLDKLNFKMIQKGLMNPDGTLTASYESLKREAVQTLGSVLDREKKLALVGEFLDVAGCDDMTDDSELTTVFAAAQTLGLDSSDVYELVRASKGLLPKD